MRYNKWKYNVSATWTKDNIKCNYVTQLYQIGIYIIFNNNPSLQFNNKPSSMVYLIKKLNKQFKGGIIKDLVFGREITIITDDNGFYKELI